MLIYVPSIANFRLTWLADRLTMADTASVVLAALGGVRRAARPSRTIFSSAVGATAIVIRNGAVSRLIATVEMPPDGRPAPSISA